jgi:[FeFe] hydrogenase H-cluster maturation GTPase HydF
MGLNETPAADRVHIAFFGRRNTGKSSLLNALIGQDLAIVSALKGTTTDPVYKAMELLPLGPVMLIDTPGIDDEGTLGELRVKKAGQILHKTDLALLVTEAGRAKSREDRELIAAFQSREIPYLLVYNKSDLLTAQPDPPGADEIYVSALTKDNISQLKEKIAALSAGGETKLRIVADLISPADFVLLVTPVDKAAPKGRLILPQQQTIRDILEADAAAIVVKEFELRETLQNLRRKPKLIITDSQVFAKVSADTPADIALTSFSILFARYKGVLEAAVKGVKSMECLQDGDQLLISEGCTHHRQCDDIGTVKLPRWIRNYTGKELRFAFTAGGEFPEDLSPYALTVHCGGCMLTERAMKYRYKAARNQQRPITNYGVSIAYMQGILRRSLSFAPHLMSEF